MRRSRWLLILLVLFASAPATLASCCADGNNRGTITPSKRLSEDDPVACDAIGIVIPGGQLDQTPTDRSSACGEDGVRSWMICDWLTFSDSILCTLTLDHWRLTTEDTEISLSLVTKYGDGSQDWTLLPAQAPGTGLIVLVKHPTVPDVSKVQMQWAFVSGGWTNWAYPIQVSVDITGFDDFRHDVDYFIVGL